MAIWPEPEYGRPVSHIVRGNYFSRPRYSPKADGSGKWNGQETIRVGTSHVSLYDAGCLIENNVFDRCSGEAEIVSIKSGKNIVRGNIFLACEGTVVLRHGNGSIIENNYFDGQNAAGTGGIRIVGTDHVIRGNYMQDLAGEGGYEYAICFVMGVENAVLNSYSQVERAIVEGNVAIDCAQGLGVNRGAGSGAPRNQPLVSSRVADNVFVSKSVAASVLEIEPKDVVWANNVFEGGEFIDTSASALGGVKASSAIERREAPVFEFGPSWKNIYQ